MPAGLGGLHRKRRNFTVSPGAALTIISYAYRFMSNFAFLAVVYFTLNFLTKYEERTIIAALVLAYSIMRVVSAVRQFHFYLADRAPRGGCACSDGECRRVGRQETGDSAKLPCCGIRAN